MSSGRVFTRLDGSRGDNSLNLIGGHTPIDQGLLELNFIAMFDDRSRSLDNRMDDQPSKNADYGNDRNGKRI